MALSRFVLPYADVGAGIRPSSGAKLFFYASGTSTFKSTFTDGTGSTPHANPVIANANGVFPGIFFNGVFNVALKDANDVQIWTADPVTSNPIGTIYATTLDLIASEQAASSNDIVECQGYTTKGDGGGAQWKQNGVTGQTVSQSPTQLGDALLNDGNGNQWTLVNDILTKSESLGAVGVGSATVAIESSIKGGFDVNIRNDNINIDNTINSLSSQDPFKISGSTKTILQKTGNNGNCIAINQNNFSGVTDLTIALIDKEPATVAQGLTIFGSDYALIRDVDFTGIDGIGFGCFIYGGGSIAQPSFARIENTRHFGTTDATLNQSNGGAMLDNCTFSLLSKTWTKGIERFPVELKGNATYCIVENSFIDDCTNGLYYGSESSNHPSYSIANNLIVKSFDIGYYSGYGSHNISHNLLLDVQANDGTKNGTGETIGLKAINVTDSIFTNLLTASNGSDLDMPVGLYGTAERNHISIAPRHNNVAVVDVGVNARLNSVEILGIKSGTSIFSAGVVNYQAANHSGGNGNPIYNHATGEYWGSISGRYRWRLEDAAAVTLFSTDAFVHDIPTNQDGRIAITCSDSYKAGFAVVTPTKRAELRFYPSFDGWQLSAGSTLYRFKPAVFSPTSSSVASLGEAGALWTEVFATNGTINTSDERLKTELLDVNEAELAAAVEVKANIKKFKMLDSVDKKGDAARIHFGVGAQTVKKIFEKHGLDANDYSLFCYDEWEAEPEEVDENGKITFKGRDAGNAYGIRYNQLIMFILATL
jgi:hypothetical protein